jgi:hypothetical protein
VSFLNEGELFAVGAGMNPGSVKEVQINVARTAAAPDKTDLPLIGHAIKQAKALYIFRRSVALSFPAIPDGGFVQLPIVATHPLESNCKVKGTILITLAFPALSKSLALRGRHGIKGGRGNSIHTRT